MYVGKRMCARVDDYVMKCPVDDSLDECSPTSPTATILPPVTLVRHTVLYRACSLYVHRMHVDTLYHTHHHMPGGTAQAAQAMA